MSSFVHLHLHSQYSLLDGANRLDDLLEAAQAAEMPAMALTDHGNMFGAIDFYNRANAAGVKPILGMEAYVAQGSRTDRTPSRSSSNHLVLLARNEDGYRNLIKLTSDSYLEGFYYKPRIDMELLRRHSEGLICLSACLKGKVIQQILGNQEEEALATAQEFADIFGKENFFLELQDHGIEEQRLANEVLRRISRKTGIQTVITNDCHYLRKSDAFAHDVLLCIGTQRTLADTNRLRYASDEFYLKTGDELFSRFPKDAQALENTLAIAERCDLTIPTGEFHLPDFPVPTGYDLDTYFEKAVMEGFQERLAELKSRGSRYAKQISEEIYMERLRSELQVIQRMGFSGYFLIVWDFIRHARDNAIPVGPGRGSAAGSLVAYCLRITDIDPLRYDLLFERFLNPDRVSLPDIDIDFCMRRRGEVIQYVSEKYGRDRVAQIITFGTLAAKAVLRDVGRVMGIPYAKVDRIAKLIPDMTRSLSEAAKSVDALAGELERDPEVRKIVEVGTRLEGLTRHASLHAAGVVITPRPIAELVPLYKTSKDEIVTQWDKDVIEDLGLLKMDFLGLRTLTVIDDTLKILKQQGVDLDLDAVPLDDPESYRLFCDGRTSGIFQFESSGMRDLLRRGQPTLFADLAAFNALYRPGALSVGMVEEYIKRKRGQKKVRYILPETRPILEETYGVIAYQEQVMQIAVQVAGFTLGEADILRKAMGKKKPKVMAEQKEKFVEGAAKRQVAAKKARELWEYIEPFAGYGFNKSHSVAYAMLAYKTAYLKAHHPVAFMSAMLTSEMSSKDNVAKYFQECRGMGIAVLPPDVNESSWSFTAVGDDIRFGLGAVKGVGASAVESILEARRESGRFESLWDFAMRVDPRALNHKAFESLIKGGCFDELGSERRATLEVLDRVLGFAQKKRREKEEGQSSLFGEGAADEGPMPDAQTIPWSERDRLRYEKEALGFYLTGNPLSEYGDRLHRLTTHDTASLGEGAEGSVAVGGLITRIRVNKIKSGPNAGRQMARFVLEDLQGTIPVAVFADKLQECGSLIKDEAIVVVKGAARDRGAEVELTLEELVSLEKAEDELVDELRLDLSSRMSTGKMLELRDLLVENSGDLPVRMSLRLDGRQITITPEDRFRVRLDDGLIESIERILGPGTVEKHYAAPISQAIH
jgi:DNA polymerase-3 subunit alpha